MDNFFTVNTVATTATATDGTIIPSRYFYTGTTTVDIPYKKKYFKCEWCDSIWEEAGNCKNCGAPLKMMGWIK